MGFSQQMQTSHRNSDCSPVGSPSSSPAVRAAPLPRSQPISVAQKASSPTNDSNSRTGVSGDINSLSPPSVISIKLFNEHRDGKINCIEIFFFRFSFAWVLLPESLVDAGQHLVAVVVLRLHPLLPLGRSWWTRLFADVLVAEESLPPLVPWRPSRVRQSGCRRWPMFQKWRLRPRMVEWCSGGIPEDLGQPWNGIL